MSLYNLIGIWLSIIALTVGLSMHHRTDGRIISAYVFGMATMSFVLAFVKGITS